MTIEIHYAITILPILYSVLYLIIAILSDRPNKLVSSATVFFGIMGCTFVAAILLDLAHKFLI